MGNFSQEGLFFSKVGRKFGIQFLSEVFKGNVGDEFGIFERKICNGRFVLPFQPVSDGLSFIGVSIGSYHGLYHLSFGYGAGTLLLKGFNKVRAFAIHINNFYKVYQIKSVIYWSKILQILHVSGISYFFYTTPNSICLFLSNKILFDYL